MEFLEFDKYATHMWSVYLLALLLIVANSWWSRAELKSTRERMQRRVAARGTAAEKGELL